MDMNSPETQRRAMHLVMDTGKLLLENGGEVFRVQQTMQIMASSLGIEDFNTYVVTNGIFASANDCNEVRHIPSVSIHLARVEALNELSRELAAGTLDLEGAEQRLETIRAMPARRPAVIIAAAAAGSAGFASAAACPRRWVLWPPARWRASWPICAAAGISAAFSPTSSRRRQALRWPCCAVPSGRRWTPASPPSAP